MNTLQTFRRRESEKARTQALPKPSEAPEASYCNMNQCGQVCMLPLRSILPNPAQPRKHFDDNALIRLADSIRRYGILQPLAVRQCQDKTGEHYELVAGERRLRASALLRMESVPCIIVEADQKKSAELAMIENIQRENLNMFEQASAIQALLETYHMTQEQIARRLSASQSYVANKLRILRLTPEERETVLRGGLSERHARAVLKLPEDKRADALRHMAKRSMNVASAEEYIEHLLNEARQEPIRQLEYKMLRQDIRLFYNTVDRALETVRRAGIAVLSDRREVDGGMEMVIRIPSPYKNAS